MGGIAGEKVRTHAEIDCKWERKSAVVTFSFWINIRWKAANMGRESNAKSVLAKNHKPSLKGARVGPDWSDEPVGM